ncbi:PHP domain-containing protein [Tessaracoccus sp. MC1756]|uniref:PHP domain-containing protein n=1 Tax=Tessaracoccus sp. MC1756 TaxID=2760311 RepID=UPI0016040732|nr:PHP domain-containing protein [Tessaracoccus sp. MC1756]MBB1509812.1 PHP domain-containing protein [Tessaracoccus sp. MC1756]
MTTTINDPNATPVERLDALREHLATNPDFPPFVTESNNHVHTIYSFSPYTPAMAALRAREAGLTVVGSVDHDSAAGAAEMTAAAEAVGLGSVTGFECRVYVHSADDVAAGRAPFHDRKLNNPDTAGIVYMTVQGIPASSRDAAAEFLKPIREARLKRTATMVENANAILDKLGAPLIDVETDIVGRSQFLLGGTVTERHLLAAMADKLIERFGRGESLVDGLAQMGLNLSDKVKAQLADVDNPHLTFDLLGVMKAEFLDQIYVIPERFEDGGECPTMAEVIAFAKSIGAIPCYAYLGDVTASPTGDKKAEKFEDDFLDELVEFLGEIGMPAITYMPPRNTSAQMARIADLADRNGLLEVSGVDINTPRQVFNCPELQRPELDHLNDATWAMVAHERLAENDRSLGLFAENSRLAGLPLKERVARYSAVGREMIQDGLPVADAAARLIP